MSNMLGMDIQGVRALAQQMDSAAQDISQLANQLTHALQNAVWVGPDREAFVSDWQSSHVTALNTVVQGLQTAAQKANQNAQEQENTSNQ